MAGIPISKLIDPAPNNAIEASDLVPAFRPETGTIKVPGAAFKNAVTNASTDGIPLVGTSTYANNVGTTTPIKTLRASGSVTIDATNTSITIGAPSFSNATETVQGVAKIATTQQVNLGENDLTIVSPYKLSQRISLIPTAFVPLSGGTMSGALTLPSNPTANLHAATKQYVDVGNILNANSVFANTTNNSASGTSLSVSGTNKFVGNLGTGLAAVTLSAGNGLTLTANNDILAISQASSGVPTGAIMPFYLTSAPSGWIACDGSTISNSGPTAALYAAIGGTLPDLRGYFVRGVGTNTDGTTSGLLGIKQTDTFKSHAHTGTAASAGAHTHQYYKISVGGAVANSSIGWAGINTGGSANAATGSAGDHSHTLALNNTGDSETRPRNIAFLYCIKL